MYTPLQDLFEEYLLECEFSQKLRSETLVSYKNVFSLFIKLVPDATPETLIPATMTKFFKLLQERKRLVGKGVIKVGIKKNTVATYWRKLSSFFQWLVRNKHISSNPLRDMRYPTPVYDERKYLSKHHIERIITAIHVHSTSPLLLRRDLTIFYILLFCGLRRQELLSLQIRDIDIERKLLTVRAENSKVALTRHIPLHSDVVRHLKQYLQERKKFTTPYLIVSNNLDAGFTKEGLKHLVKKLNTLSKVPFHLHQFRHTFAINFLTSSNNVVKLKQLLGHKSIAMTLVYLRVLPVKEMRGDIENLQIDSML